jgi:hypothetical protein
MKLADKAGDMRIALPNFGRKTVDNSTIPAKQLHSLSTPQPQLSILAAIKFPAPPTQRQRNTRHRQLRSSDQRQGMVDDFEDILKRYPAQTLAAAAFLGFLVGRAFCRYD